MRNAEQTEGRGEEGEGGQGELLESNASEAELGTALTLRG